MGVTEKLAQSGFCSVWLDTCLNILNLMLLELDSVVQYPNILSIVCIYTGSHNLRSFLAANSTQNYFLVARMLSFL